MDTQIGVFQFREASVKVPVERMRNAKVVWINREDKFFPVDLGCVSDNDFCRMFAYGIRKTECFSEISFDSADVKIHHAERYGGSGIGTNGGGGRTTNFGDFQLKGTGRNCLVGVGTEDHHGYGGLDAPMAIAESINSVVLSKILPVGVAKVYGVIRTAENSGTYGMDAAASETCWGAILVRETCLRPAHFLRSPSFTPPPEYRFNLTSDVARTRSVNQEFKGLLGGNKAYIKMIGKFLYNCANQMAFARVARICHGAMSPSNIALDGRWLDIPLASFLSGGVNYCRANPFYSEAFLPLAVVEELLHTYSKYNDEKLDARPLESYYLKQFDLFYSHHIGFLFSISPETLSQPVRNHQWMLLYRTARSVIDGGASIGPQQPAVVLDDPVIAFIEGLFLYLAGNDFCWSRLAIALPRESDLSLLCVAFREIMESAFESVAGDYASFGQFISCCAMRSLKKARMSSVFYSSSMDVEIYQMHKSNSYDDAHALIEGYRAIAEWIYQSDSDKEICLFRNDVVSIDYSLNEAAYRLFARNEVVRFPTFLKLLAYLGSVDRNAIRIRSFSLDHYVFSLQAVLPSLDDIAH